MPYAKFRADMLKTVPRISICSADANALTVPWTNTRLGDRSFSVAGPKVCNSFPATLRQRHIKPHCRFARLQRTSDFNHEGSEMLSLLTIAPLWNLKSRKMVVRIFIDLKWRNRGENMSIFLMKTHQRSIHDLRIEKLQYLHHSCSDAKWNQT